MSITELLSGKAIRNLTQEQADALRNELREHGKLAMVRREPDNNRRYSIRVRKPRSKKQK